MPRSISWQPDLHNIHRRVTESSQTGYGRAHIEQLFDVGHSAAQMLLELMPRSQVGTGVLVAREDLLAWLGQCLDAEDLRAHLAAIRARAPKPQHRKLRVRMPRHVDEGKLSTLRQHGIWIERGKLTVYFTTLDDCIAKMLQFSEAAQTTEFERRFCEVAEPIARSPRQAVIAQDCAYVRACTRFTESVFAAEKSSASGDHNLTQKLKTRACEAFAEIERLSAENGHAVDELYARAHAALCAPSS